LSFKKIFLIEKERRKEERKMSFVLNPPRGKSSIAGRDVERMFDRVAKLEKERRELWGLALSGGAGKTIPPLPPTTMSTLKELEKELGYWLGWMLGRLDSVTMSEDFRETIRKIKKIMIEWKEAGLLKDEEISFLNARIRYLVAVPLLLQHRHGSQRISSHLHVKDTEQSLNFYTKGLGGKVIHSFPSERNF
jgi:hypothetical protein